jgi:hypothetical protein
LLGGSLTPILRVPLGAPPPESPRYIGAPPGIIYDPRGPFPIHPSRIPDLGF